MNCTLELLYNTLNSYNIYHIAGFFTAKNIHGKIKFFMGFYFQFVFW